MIVSTKGRYALRIMIDLAEHASDGCTSAREIAKRQEISKKYIEQIVPALVKAGFIEGIHGNKGGYRLKKPPEECVVGEILRITEGDLAPVACLSCNAEPCSRYAECKTIAMWQRFNEITNDYFDKITVSDLLK